MEIREEMTHGQVCITNTKTIIYGNTITNTNSLDVDERRKRQKWHDDNFHINAWAAFWIRIQLHLKIQTQIQSYMKIREKMTEMMQGQVWSKKGAALKIQMKMWLQM